MARRKDSPQKAAMREMMRDYLKNNDISIKDGTDVNSIMRDMMSVLLEGALDEELDEELGYSKYDYRNKETDNSRNGHSSKTMHTSYGDMDVAIPRDRNGDYEPQLIKKYQNTVTQDMEEKILSMYAKGMTTGDIESHMRELYDIDISDSTISRITDKILPIVKEWQERPLEEVYAVVFMDAIHYHVRSEGRIVKRAVYIALGIDMNGKKDVLGMYVGENESAKFWLSIMNGLKNRGVEDILIACVDGLNGFPQAIEAVYPKTEIQQCIIHQIRNSTKFVSYKDIKKQKEEFLEAMNQADAIITEAVYSNEKEKVLDHIRSLLQPIQRKYLGCRPDLVELNFREVFFDYLKELPSEKLIQPAKMIIKKFHIENFVCNNIPFRI